MKKYRLGIVLVSSILLVACSAEKEEPVADPQPSKIEQTTSTTEQTSSVTQSSSSTNQEKPSEVVHTAWNAQKAQQLRNYIVNEWGPALGQEYQSYDVAHDANFYGMAIPSKILNPSLDSSQFPSMIPNFAGQTPYLVWSENGQVGVGQIALVAVYSDIETASFPTAHLYLFTIDKGVPQVWITEQNQGNPERTLYFRETANEALKNFFARLVAE